MSHGVTDKSTKLKYNPPQFMIGTLAKCEKIIPEQNKISPKIYGNVSTISLGSTPSKIATKGTRRVLAFLRLPNKHCLRGVFLQQPHEVVSQRQHRKYVVIFMAVICQNKQVR